MDNLKIGHKITEPRHRDAIHMAMAPVIAAVAMLPGTHVSLNADGRATNKGNPIGIVDPFLRETVNVGDEFWLFIYPGTITGLRHEWNHPAFKTEAMSDGMAYSVRWVEDYVKRNCPYDGDYDGFMERVRRGDIFYHGRDLSGPEDLDNPEQLFQHLSVILGRNVGSGDFGYSCSC